MRCDECERHTESYTAPRQTLYNRRLACAKNGGTDADFGGAEFDRLLEVRGHSHRQMLQAIARSDGRELGEIGRGEMVDRRDAHQPLDGETKVVTAMPDETVSVRRHDPCFLGLFADVHLHEKPRSFSLPYCLSSDFRRQFRAIDRFDDVEQPHGVADLVGLQRPDEA